MSQYYQPLEADSILYALWKRLEHIQPTKFHIKEITEKDLSLLKKRAAAVARYAVRIIAPEALDIAGKTEEAQKLRDLPDDVVLTRARNICEEATGLVVGSTYATYAAIADAYHAAGAASAAIDYAGVADYAASAAYNVGKMTNKQRTIYHLNQMIQICLVIK